MYLELLKKISLIAISLSLAHCSESSNGEKQTPPEKPEIQAYLSENLMDLAKVEDLSLFSDEHPVILQFFEWYLPADSQHWNRMKESAFELRKAGFDALWIPPAQKSFKGRYDVGYAVYDLYDLGEFRQKSSTATKYGTKTQLLNAIEAVQAEGLKVYADIVLNHRIGADATEKVQAVAVSDNNRYQTFGNPITIDAYTRFDFPGRRDRYSDFKWNWTHFTAVDYAANLPPSRSVIYKFIGDGKDWSSRVSSERGNYDFLLGADVDTDNPEVIDELDSWGRWFLDTTKVDGFRLDAVKHIDWYFIRNWLKQMNDHKKTPLFALGEYWSKDTYELMDYLKRQNSSDQALFLFDVALHENFHLASIDTNFDLRKIFENTLTKLVPERSVSLVENHDTQPLQALESPVEEWFKPHAYALSLLRKQGIPSVFYADYYGSNYSDTDRNGQLREVQIAKKKALIDKLILARKTYLNSEQIDYFAFSDTIGWINEAGLAVTISSSDLTRSLRMNVGLKHAGACLEDLFEQAKCVEIDENGWGEFESTPRSLSVWVARNPL